MAAPNDIIGLRDRGALFVISHSAGKDSQAMTAVVRNLVPDAQILVVHAHLEGMEWEGTIEHIEATTQGLPLIVAYPTKTFEEMVRHRRYWPSPQARNCTSDLKRGPIEREIRRYMKILGLFLVVNCMGLRAEESPNRARQSALKFNDRNSKAGREWYDWLPIHEFTTEEVFATIREAGQEPHWAYTRAGASRLSCALCIMASRQDLEVGARHNPEIFRRLNALEREIDQTFVMPVKGQERRFLDDIITLDIRRAA